MKLAEALQERADLNRNIEQLKSRLNSNMLVQEGEKSAENPEKLKKELDVAIARLAELISKINLTNCSTLVDGQTMTELIARKDALTLKISIYKELVRTASQTAYRARGSEIKVKSTIEVTKWQSQIDRMAKELRKLDNKLQETNWNTELVELE
ncbi:MAG: DIP1984 family protein [Lachnospiraceae bacterium]|nr:DIP1984 family protein [Lachnospiraceae bacterium]